jgi:uncharacterized membrane protein
MSGTDEDTSGDLSLDRLVFFSDAVFAIAVTLLVLDIHVPDLPRIVSNADAWLAFTDLTPSFFAFVLRFLVIGRFWMGHHERFRTLRHFDPRLMWPNMLYLMAVAYMPFATAFLGRNLGHFVPELVYNLSMLVVSLLAYWLASVVHRAGGPDSPPADGLDMVLAALVCIGLTFVAPILSQWGMFTALLWARLEKRIGARAASPSTTA